MSDSLLNVKMDSSFIECIRYLGTWETFSHRCVDLDLDSFLVSKSKPIKYVNVYYDFINLCNQRYGYKIGGYQTSGGFYYTFDFDYNLVCEPGYELIRAISEAHRSCYISYDEAQKIAINNTQPKSRKTWTNYLINDLTINRVYWLVERETGFRNGVVEKLKIDAISGDIIEKEEMNYYKKNFFKAIADKIFKVP